MWLSADPHDPWKDVWVAGLTSKCEDPSRALTYLMCVDQSFLNQYDLWNFLDAKCRAAKSASRSPIGDLYQPKMRAARQPHNPPSYHVPMFEHVHDRPHNPGVWRRDIWRWRSRHHRLLLGQETQSYRWPTVKIILKLNAIGASAHHAIYDSLKEFIDDLQEFDA